METLVRRLDAVHARWRDPLLTLLTVELAFVLFAMAPLHAMGLIDARWFNGVLTLVAMAALFVLARSAAPLLGIVLGICLIGATVVLRARGGNDVLDVCLEAGAWLTIGLTMIWVVARAVFAPGRITYHRIVGAILLYLAIGLAFVALYALVGALLPGSFSGLTVSDRGSLASDLVYFSFTTLTTVGYGDIAPVHPLARTLSNLEAIAGQLYPATLLARIVSLEVAARS